MQSDVADVDSTVLCGLVDDPVASGRLGGIPAGDSLTESMCLHVGIPGCKGLDGALDLPLDGLVQPRQILDGLWMEDYRPRLFQTSSAFTGWNGWL